MRSSQRSLLVLFFLAVGLGGCPRNRASEEALTRDEAQLALEEAEASSSAEGLLSADVELSTNFTYGSALDSAAEELATFLRTQLPCAEVTVAGPALSIEYGVNEGQCRYRGHEFTGGSSVTVESNGDGQVRVHHEWNDLSNGVVVLNGEADVDWDFVAKSRHVVHHTEWTHLASGRTGSGEGDRTQTALPGGADAGIHIEGTRAWTGARGRWDLAIDGVEMRWDDPVPQAGSYTLATPFEKTLTLAFARVDADTIQVTVEGPRRSFSFDVSKP